MAFTRKGDRVPFPLDEDGRRLDKKNGRRHEMTINDREEPSGRKTRRMGGEA